MNNYQKGWKKTKATEKEFINAEKKRLIKGLFKDDPERYYKARLAKIFSLTRERIDQIIREK
jgi:hypothetical protein